MDAINLRVLSYNIHKGFSLGNTTFVLDQIREAIREVHADLVFLQEVCGENHKNGKHFEEHPTRSQFEYLADGIWHHHAYGMNAVYDAGHHGNAILSKYPITEYTNIDISTNRIEQRGMLHAVIHIPDIGRDIHALCLHLGLTPRGRKAQLQQICERVKSEVKEDAPLILAGDFNDWAKVASSTLHESIQVEEAFKRTSGKYAATYPSALPLLALDRIYTKSVEVVKCEVLQGRRWKKLSDHIGLLAELVITA